MNKTDRAAFVAGLMAGFKRVNLRKVQSDVRDEYGSFVAGYAVGFIGKALLVIGGAYAGMQVPV